MGQSDNILHQIDPSGAEPGVTDLSFLPFSELATSQQDAIDFLSMDFSPTDFEFAPSFAFPFAHAFETSLPSLSLDSTGKFDPFVTQSATCLVGEASRTIASTQLPPVTRKDGFSLRHLDPVESKCCEIRDLLQGSESLLQQDVISKYITRENVLICNDLFGRHLQRNIPILHSSTFRLIEASPILLLAITLGGACYSDGVIPTNNITKFAMRLLVLIESQAHEMNMQVPNISTVQASVISCIILASSSNDVARKFVSVHLARNISMADRLGVFDEVEMIDYTGLTEESFNWSSWIQQESRKRIACQIFGLDMACCTFLGKPPTFSPFSFKVELPCFEKCWEADTGADCLQQIQALPRPVDVSTAMRTLRSFCGEETLLLEVSGFGMFILMMGLHGFLFRTTQEDLESHLSLSLMPKPLLEGIEPITLLPQQLTGESIATLADVTIEMYGSAAMQHFNTTLKAWRLVWGQRQVRDQESESRTFSADPLPFWYLAKIYQVFHYYGKLVGDQSEFKVPRGMQGHEWWRAEIQDKILTWLGEFRRQACEEVCGTVQQRETARMARATEEDSLLPMLMKPL